jgi:hypothetical protein
VTFRRRVADGGIELEFPRLPHTVPLPGHLFARRRRVVVGRVDEEDGRVDPPRGGQEALPQLLGLPPRAGRGAEADDREEGRVTLGGQQGERPPKEWPTTATRPGSTPSTDLRVRMPAPTSSR